MFELLVRSLHYGRSRAVGRHKFGQTVAIMQLSRLICVLLQLAKNCLASKLRFPRVLQLRLTADACNQDAYGITAVLDFCSSVGVEGDSVRRG